jgi:hypothetical protein
MKVKEGFVNRKYFLQVHDLATAERARNSDLSRIFFENFPWCISAQLPTNLPAPLRHGPTRLAVQ